HGTTGDDIDFALLVDGLEAEREQGITIDVAYRFFATPKRKFIVADTPGHEQYTRNMATGASTADLAIVLIDARQGMLRQTRRHSIIASLLGIRHIVLAVNKIDLVDFDQAVFDSIVEDYRQFS
ncbi:MAG: adenylyl-sulfate kinase, partial [Mesorhizobium sp.]